MIQIKAELVAVGDSQEADLGYLPPDAPRALFVRDGKPLLIVGLTKDEARALAPMLFETVSIGVQP